MSDKFTLRDFLVSNTWRKGIMAINKEELKKKLKQMTDKYVNKIQPVNKGANLNSSEIGISEAKKLANEYIDNFRVLEDFKSRLAGLYEAKEDISEKTFVDLENEYKESIALSEESLKHLSVKIRDECDNKSRKMENIGSKVTELDKHINEENRLLEVGAINMKEYLHKTNPLKSDKKKLVDEYKKHKKVIQILTDSMKNPTTVKKESPPHEDFEYASFSSRVSAVILDFVVVGIPLIAIGLFIPIVGWVISPVAGVLYNPVLESSEWQGTIGKKIMGIIVVDLYGSRIDFKTALFRYLAKTLSGLILCIGYFMMLFSSRKQCLHDLIVETLVIKYR